MLSLRLRVDSLLQEGCNGKLFYTFLYFAKNIYSAHRIGTFHCQIIGFCKNIDWPPAVWREMYRVIHKSLRYFRTPRYNSRDSHAEVEHVNRARDTPNFCPTLQVLDMSTLGDGSCHPCNHVPATQCNVCGRNLITGLTSAASPRVDVSSTCKV